ncbi:aspartate carbamoyltransferase [Batrachochytrium salamandrivorans]|nr:aspartate carbamoyltransferase [Batrachochytrium salamandrivorans]
MAPSTRSGGGGGGKRAKAEGFFTGKDVITVDSLEVDGVNRLLALAAELHADRVKNLAQLGRGKIVSLAFLEPSTRTCCSFSAAAQRLGCGVIYTNATESSVTKGETLVDTARCLASYADCIVLRHPKHGAAKEAAEASAKPIINAGDGTGEHPTQALLDLYTILRHFQAISPTRKLRVTFLGDAKNGRTVHSLVKLLAKMLPGQVEVKYVTPQQLQMPDEVTQPLTGVIDQSSHVGMTDEILHNTDVLYVTRVQKERFVDLAAYQDAMKNSFVVDPAVMAKLHDKAVVMHPLPRVDEISPLVDTDPRALYFEQMENGMFVRMALLAMVLGVLE